MATNSTTPHGYLTAINASQEVAQTITISLYGLTTGILAAIAISIILSRLYFRWMANAPVTNTGISVAGLIGAALLLTFIVPGLFTVLGIGVVAAIANKWQPARAVLFYLRHTT